MLFGKILVNSNSFTNQEFKLLKNIVLLKTGIELSEEKIYRITNRLIKRLKQQSWSMKQYTKMLETTPKEEQKLINLVTNSSTAFFRENQHFEYLKHCYLPSLLTLKERVRIWSASCSTGEEAYSIAMIVNEILPPFANKDVKILATDINTQSLWTARFGVYPMSKISELSKPRQLHNFTFQEGEKEAKVKNKLRSMITFNQLNLIDPWPMKGIFDVIFICNTLLYFEKTMIQEVLKKMNMFLELGGILIVGHTEGSYEFLQNYNLIGSSIYQKPK